MTGSVLLVAWGRQLFAGNNLNLSKIAMKLKWFFIILAGILLLSASGRVGNSDADAMLTLSRSMLSGSLEIPASNPYAVRGTGGHSYSPFGLLTSAWWIPFVVAGKAFFKLAPMVSSSMWEEFFVSMSANLIILLLLVYLAHEWRRLELALTQIKWGLALVLFGTMLWPYSKIPMSDPIMALCVFAAYCHWQRSVSLGHALVAGIWLGLALLCRRQAYAIVPLLAVLFIRFPGTDKLVRRGFCLVAGMLPFLAIQLGYNLLKWGSIFDQPEVTGAAINAAATTFHARVFFLNLFGLDYGFFVYNPVLLGIACAVAAKARRHLEYFCFSVLVLLVLCGITAQHNPNGQFHVPFGPRYMIFAIPFFAIGWAYVANNMSKAWKVAIATLFLCGGIVQFLGVTTDGLAAYWRREMSIDPKEWIILAHAREFERVTGIDRSLPDKPNENLDIYLNHPAFQGPDLWWCHFYHLTADRGSKR